jgi:hypothetical protein
MPGHQLVDGSENKGVAVAVRVIVLVGEGIVAVCVTVGVAVCVAVGVKVTVAVGGGTVIVGFLLTPPSLSLVGQGRGLPDESKPQVSCACAFICGMTAATAATARTNGMMICAAFMKLLRVNLPSQLLELREIELPIGYIDMHGGPFGQQLIRLCIVNTGPGLRDLAFIPASFTDDL